MPIRKSSIRNVAGTARFLKTLSVVLVLTGAWSDFGMAQTPSDGDLQIVSGTDAGRLQIWDGKADTAVWKGICNDDWNRERWDNAGVACRQLGYRAGSAIERFTVSSDNNFLLDDVRCTGHEGNLLACGNAGRNIHNCKDNEHVGVTCNDDAPLRPQTLIAEPGDGRVALSWAAPSHAGTTLIVRYEFWVKLDDGINDELWTEIPNSAPGQTNALSYTVATYKVSSNDNVPIVNDTLYAFRVRAVNGSDTGAPSREATATPAGEGNNAPTFDDGDTATRSVAENTAADTAVGAPMLAKDGDNDSLTYTLGGTDGTSFRVDDRGQLRTNAALDHEAQSTYVVTVTVSDGTDTDTITVTINVTDVAEPPPAPAAPTFPASTANSLSVSWSAPAITGRPAIDDYDVRWRVKTPSGSWIELAGADSTATAATITGLDAATTYEVQVRATNAEGDSPWSASRDGTTSAPPPPSAPAITSVAFANAPTSGQADYFKLGDEVDVAVTWDAAVTVDGTPSVRLLVGSLTDAATDAAYVSGSGTAALTFRYRVAAGHQDDDGLSVPAGSVALNGATIVKQGTAVNAGLALTAVAPDMTRKVDGVAPTASRIGIPNNPYLNTHAPNGQTADINWIVVFSEAVVVVGTPYVEFTLGAATKQARYTGLVNSIDGILPLQPEFVYTVVDGDFDGDGVGHAADPVRLNGGSIRDKAGNDAVFDITPNPLLEGHKVDAVKPVLQTAAVTGTTLTLTYDEALDNTGPSPSASAFTVALATGTAPMVSTVAVSGRAVTLTLSQAVLSGDVVTLSYTAPTGMDATPIRDAFGNVAGDLVNQEVANATTNATPSFTEGEPATRSVPENTEADENVGAAVTATDADADAGDTLTYSLEGSDATSFDIGASTGQIKTKTELDFETKESYAVTVKATDRAGATATIAVTIDVTDEAEAPDAPAAPTVTTGSDTASLDVTWQVPTNAGPPITDYDVRYRKQSPLGDWTGVTDTTSTALTATITGLDAATTYQVQVRADNDEGVGGWSATGEGTTSAAANAAPSFTSSATANVAENTTPVLTVVAIDEDTEDTVTNYAIQGGDDQSTFALGATSGALTFVTAPNFENPTDTGGDNNYKVLVQATSGAGDRMLTATQTITVTVTDDDTEAPGKPATPSVTAGSDATTLIATWAEPSNAGPPITDYGVQYRAGDSGSFTDWTHSGTGRSATITGLTATTTYQVQVQATNDEGTGAWSDSGAGTTGVAQEPEDGDLRIVGGGTSGRLQIRYGDDWKGICNDKWDELHQDNAGVACRQLDYRAGSAIESIAVPGDRDFLLDDVFCAGHEADFLACGHAGLNVHNCNANEHVGVSCSDAAPSAPRDLNAEAGNRQVALSWRAPTSAGDTAIVRHEFAANEHGGRYETWTWTAIPDSAPGEANAASYTVDDVVDGKSYSFLVRAVNGSTPGTGGPSNVATATLGGNNAPSFTDGPTTIRSVAENTAAGHNIGSPVSATDADSGATLTYTLGGSDAASFRIVETSGQLRTNAPLDHEAKPSYAVTVTVSDGIDTDSIAVTIEVTDVAEAPGAPDAPSVSAGSDVTSLIVTWAAPSNTGPPITDYDVRYRVASPPGTWAELADTTDSTATAATLAGLTASTRHDVQVRAQNAEGTGGWSGSGEGTTSAADNTAPTFTSSNTASVAENTTTVLTVVATDADTDDSVTGYAIHGGADRTKFALSETSGALAFATAPNFENPTDDGTNNLYVVVVRATGGTGGRALTADQTITVTVTDDDSEAPGKPATPGVIAGSEPTSLDVTWTEPPNAGPAITGYGVQYRAGDSGSFTDWPHSGTGRSTTITGLLASTAYQVQVRATSDEGTGAWSDSGAGTTEVAPMPGDLRIVGNDPATGRLQIQFGGVWKGICNDKWDDPDQDNAGVACRQLGYRAGSVMERIAVPGDTDFLLDDLDCVGHEADLLACAHAGVNTHNCTAGEHVGVSCSNAAPSAPPDLNAVAGDGQVALSWRAPTSAGDTDIVRHEFAANADGRGYERWTAIPDSAPDEANALAYTVGDVVNGKSYRFLVRAVNDSIPGTGGPSNEAAATPVGVNNAPTFTDGETTRRSVAENTASGRNIGSAVAATDADDDTLTYTLEGTDAVSFDIVATSGQLRTSAALDYESKSSYAVTVTVSDGTDADTIAVTIDVTDVDETQPPSGGGGGGGGSTNRPPVVEAEIPDQALDAGAVLELDVRLNFYDRERRALTWSAESDDPAVVAVEVDDDGDMTVRALKPGLANVTVTVADHRDETVSDTFTVIVYGPSGVWLFPTASDPLGRQGFARIVNHGDVDGTVAIVAVDDTGRPGSAVTLAVGAGRTVHFNSDDLETGNDAKGLTGSAGTPTGDWRLAFDTDLDFEALSYIRTSEGFVTAMHDLAPETDGTHRVAIFNPGSNTDQVSLLRLVNPGDEAAAVTVNGTDDAGAASGTVRATVPAGASLTLTAQSLESGEGVAGLRGALGDGAGKWRLSVVSEQPIRVLSLLSSPTGHLTNLSSAPVNVADGMHTVPLFPAASDPNGRQGFVRVINRSERRGEVTVTAHDDSEWSYEPLTLAIGAGEAAQFNSDDLELGNADKGLTGSTGAGTGAWRLELSSERDIDVLAYIRTTEGFLTSMHDLAPVSGDRHRVAIFNPGSNTAQVSLLRLVNDGDTRARVTISGLDDRGAASGTVRASVPAGAALTLTAQALEAGGEGLTGSLGDGVGKWRLVVVSDRPILAMSLLSSPTGHLTNLSTAPMRGARGSVPAAQ